jgi:hypothetical protein
MKYKEGQQVKVLTDSETGVWGGHFFKIGEVVTIVEVEESYWCKNDNGHHWFLGEGELNENLN